MAKAEDKGSIRRFRRFTQIERRMKATDPLLRPLFICLNLRESAKSADAFPVFNSRFNDLRGRHLDHRAKKTNSPEPARPWLSLLRATRDATVGERSDMKRPGGSAGGFQALFEDGVVVGMTDAELLGRFTRGDADADADGAASAFAVLVERHGPMVMCACRSALGNEHDSEDAFQAVFLVLARRAQSVWVRDSLGPWLHAVAVRTSARLRSQIESQRRRDRRFAEGVNTASEADRLDDDLARAIHEEVGRLPDRFREAVVLCDLEGCSHEAAAGKLGWPIGTVKSRQTRGRERLRDRLTRRGFAPDDAVMASALAPRPIPMAAIRAAIDLTTGRAATAGAVTVGSALAREVARGMTMKLLKSSLYAVLAFGAIGVGAISITRGMRAEEGRPPRQGPDGPPAFMVPAGPRPPAGSLFALRFVATEKHDEPVSPDYQWVKLDPRVKLPLDGLIVRKEGNDTLVALKHDLQNITERDLTRVTKIENDLEEPAISFLMTRAGGRRLGVLTRSHLPEEGGSFKHHLAIVVQGVVVAAPMVLAEIHDAGVVEFGPQQPAEVEHIVQLLAKAAAYNAPPTARAVKDRAEAVREAKDVDLPALEKADRLIVEATRNNWRWNVNDANLVREFAKALTPSDAAARGGELKASLIFLKGEEPIRTVWVREGGEWGFERPSASWTTGSSPELWRLLTRRIPEWLRKAME